MSPELISTQQSSAVRPYIKCKIYDDSITFNSVIRENGGFGVGTIKQTPDGKIVVVGVTQSGNLGFWKIDDGSLASNWAANSPTIDFGIGVASENHPSISVSDWINGTYVIDIYYTKIVSGQVHIKRRRSIDGGLSFNPEETVIDLGSSYTSLSQVPGLAAGKPIYEKNGLISGIVFFINGLASNNHSINFVYYNGSSWGITSMKWSFREIDSFDWVLDSLDTFYKDEIHHIVFSGRHTVFDIDTGNSSLYETKLLKIVFNDNTNNRSVWSRPTVILSSLSQYVGNQNSFTKLKTNFDGKFVWLTFRGNVVENVSEDGTITSKTSYFLTHSKDGVNFKYPTPLVDLEGLATGILVSENFVKQGDFYYLAGTGGVVLQYRQNSTIADVTNDIINYGIDEVAGGMSSIVMTIGNQNGKWFGPSPTMSGASAIDRNKKVHLYQGYYVSNTESQVVPKNIYYIDEVKSAISVNRNDLSIRGRDFHRKLRELVSRFTYQYSAPSRYVDVFDGSTIGNWSQDLGNWQQSGNAFKPTVASTQKSTAILTGINFTTSSALISVIIKLDDPNNSTTHEVYPFFYDKNNYVTLQIIGNAGLFDFKLKTIVNGSVSIDLSLASVGGWFSTTPYIRVDILRFNYTDYIFMIYGFENLTAITRVNPSYLNVLGDPVTIDAFNSMSLPATMGLSITSSNTNPEFRNLKVFEMANSNSLKEVIQSLSSLAGIFDYVFPNVLYDNFKPDTLNKWTGTSGQFDFRHGMLNINSNSFALRNDIQIDNGEVEFEAKFDPTNPSNDYGFDFVFRSQSSSSITNCYSVSFEKRVDNTSRNHTSVKFRNRSLAYGNQMMVSTAKEVVSPIRGNNLEIDLTQWHKYKVYFDKGYMAVFIDGVMYLAWYDNNTSVTYSNGYIGFYNQENGIVRIRNLVSTKLYQQIPKVIVNPGEDIERSEKMALDTIKAWSFSDLFGRQKIELLESTDSVSYEYEDQLWSNLFDYSDLERVNQVTVIGQNVSYVLRDDSTIKDTRNAIVRDRVIVDFKIQTVSDAQKRAQYELANFNRFERQSDFKQINNVGSEIFDVVKVIVEDSNVNDVVRIYNQRIKVDGLNNEYSLGFGTGEIT
jgi:hypothetical protein